MFLLTPFTLVSVTFIWFQSHTVTMSRQKCRKGDSHECETWHCPPPPTWHCPPPPTPNPPSATLFCLTTNARTRGPCSRARARTHTHTRTRFRTHTLTHTHLCTHTHTRTHPNNTHTHMTHFLILLLPRIRPTWWRRADGSGGYEGFVVDLLDKMAEKASFNYKLKVINGTYGHQDPGSTHLHTIWHARAHTHTHTHAHTHTLTQPKHACTLRMWLCMKWQGAW